MGRAPCCDKANVKKGPWSPEEDAKLKSYIEQHGTGGNWIALPQKIGLKRCGKSCRLRWLNYLRPNIKHGGFSEEEDNFICSLYSSIGSRWSVIAAQLPGRTDNDIKNYWNTRLKKKLLGKHRKEQQARVNNSSKQPRICRGSLMNSTVPGETTGEQPYLPELPVLAPVAYMTQEPSFSDHDSIRKVLIKLGGRFSDDKEYALDGKHLQFPVGHYSPAPPQCYEQQVTTVASSACMNALNNDSVQLTHTQYFMDEAALNMDKGENALSAGFMEDMVVSANLQRLDGIDFLCGEDIVNYKLGSSGSMGASWGETSSQSQVYPSFVASSYEDMRQERPYECAFEELRCQEAQCEAVHL